jgi:ATP-dependent RNA helicase RhlB
MLRKILSSIRRKPKAAEASAAQADTPPSVPSAARRSAATGSGKKTEAESGAPAARRPRKRKPRKSAAPSARGESSAAAPQPTEALVAGRKEHGSWNPAEFEVAPAEGLTRFQDLGLVDEILHAVADMKFRYCTPIQAESLRIALAGRDVAGRAQTGTGKTAAFLIAIMNRFARSPAHASRPRGDAAAPRALVVAPTRELAMQIERDAVELGAYLNMSAMALFGGSDLERQRKKLRENNPEIVAATPGRLLDFHTRRDIDLSSVEVLVLDEADRMLDMGFIPDVRRIVRATPPKERRQTLLFSATLSDDVMRLASSWQVDPQRIDIEPEQVAVDSVRQILYLTTSREKFPLLYNILTREKPERVLMFVNRRDTAVRLTRDLKRYRFDCDLISGALSQNHRTRTLEAFREGRLPILVATDVAGRGLHIDSVSHVVNYNIPEDPEDYVHRIGRTGRAGASGISITFACEEESFGIPPIEKFIGRNLPCLHPDPAWLTIPSDIHPLPASRIVMPAGIGEGDRNRDKSGRPSGGRSGGSGSRSRSGSSGSGGRRRSPPRR